MFSGLWPNFKGALGVAPPGERCGGNSKKQKKHVSVFPPVAWPPLADNVIHSLASQLKAHPIFHYGSSPGVRVVDPRARRNSPHFPSLLFNLATSLNSCCVLLWLFVRLYQYACKLQSKPTKLGSPKQRPSSASMGNRVVCKNTCAKFWETGESFFFFFFF